MRTALAEDLDLPSITAAKIVTMEAIIAPVLAEKLEDYMDWTTVKTAMLALGFRHHEIPRGNYHWEAWTTLELDGMVVMFYRWKGPRVRLNVCEPIEGDLPEGPDFSVILTETPTNAKKIGVTMTVKRATGLLCLQDAMVIVKSAGPDCKVKACMTREEAERIKQQLEAFEATAEIKVTSPGEACANPHPYPEG